MGSAAQDTHWNIFPIAEGLDYVVVSQIRPDVGRTRHKSCTVKGVGMLGTQCEFMAVLATRTQAMDFGHSPLMIWVRLSG